MAEATSTASVSVKIRAGMTCGGCEGAVKRILGKLDGVSDVATSVTDKLVTCTVSEPASVSSVMEALGKWGAASKKEVTLLEPAAA